jgi:hypothetical protein
MRPVLIVAVFVGAAAPAGAQDPFGPNRFLQGGVTCGQFQAMDTAERRGALTAIEPLGGAVAGAEPAIVDQWAADVDAACEGDPDRPLAEAATEALGGD